MYIVKYNYIICIIMQEWEGVDKYSCLLYLNKTK